MTDEEQARVLCMSLDLSILVAGLERVKANADSFKEYRVAEKVDDILVGLYERKRALGGLIVG